MPSLSFGLHKRVDNPLGNGPIVVPIELVPPSHNRSIIAVCLACAVVSWLLWGMRLWTRAVIVRSVGSDDLTMLVALLFFSVYCASLMTICFLFGNRDYLTGPMMNITTNLLIIAEVFYVLTVIVLKISLGIFFFRVMVSKMQRRAIYLILILSTSVGIAFAFFIIFQCGVPVQATLYWERRGLQQCVSNKAILGMSYTHAAVSSSTDLSLTLLPIPMLIRSKISRNEKWIVAGIFVIASAGFMSSLGRIYWIPALTAVNFDFLKKIELLAIWSAIEPGMGMSAASLATLRPLLQSWMQHANKRRHSKNTSSNYTTSPNTATPRETNIESMMNQTYDAKPQINVNNSLNIVDAADFFDKLNSGSTDSLSRNMQYVHYNPTPKLEKDMHWNDASYKETPVIASLLNDVQELTLLERTALPYQDTTHETHTRVSVDPELTEERQRVGSNIHRATWWPLPWYYIASESESADVEAGKRG